MKAAVVGAGLCGRLLAWQLAEQGAAVTLLDRVPREAMQVDANEGQKPTGLVAAAMIAPGTEAVTTEPLVKAIGDRSLALWPGWLADLSAASGERIAMQQDGTLVVAHPADRGEWQRFMAQCDATLGADAAQRLNSEQLAALEPEIAPTFTEAAYFSDEGVLDNLQLYQALQSRLEQSTVDWQDDYQADDVLAENGQLAGFDAPFDRLFDCRGIGAKAALGTHFGGLRGVRGEVVRVFAPAVNLRRPLRLMHPRYPLYIAPHGEHRYAIGATQIESDQLGPMTIRSGLELLSALYSVHDGFSEAQILSLDVGLRPAFSDNLPKIIWRERLVSINGLHRHGYLFVPALVSDVLARLNGESVQFSSLMH